MYFAIRILRALTIVLLGVVLLPSCAQDDRLPDWAGPMGMDGGPGPSQSSDTCESRATRACGIELGTHNGVLSCAHGTQVCENGTWGTCMADATKGITSVPAPAARASFRNQLQLRVVGGDSTACEDNPCNPYCYNFNDVPDAAYEAPQTNEPTGWYSGGTLEGSNVPDAFKDKGSLNDQCSAAAGSQTWNEACQFDQHCVSGACEAFEATESGSCMGIDITVPTTCIPASGLRDVTVCNRGTAEAPAGIKCYVYSGGSPQYPEDDPGTGTLVMTTATALQPGTCETQQIAEATFGLNGIQSLMCNPPETVTATATVGANYPSTNGSISGYQPWTSPSNAYASDGVFTTATPANPNVTGQPGVTHAVSYGGFGVNSIPADATVTRIVAEAAWKISVSSTHAQFGLQSYAGGAAIGTETTSGNGSPPTTLTTVTQDASGLTLAPSTVTDGNLFVRLRVRRSDGISGGNPDFTASADYVRVTVYYTYPVPVSVDECNASNNWSATKLVPDPDACEDMSTPEYAPFTVTRVFQATCPDGTLPTWTYFGYTTSTPSGTSVEFRLQGFDANDDGTCPTATALTSGATVAVASLTADPEVCSLSDTSGACPIDLTTDLGYPDVGYECLQMDAYGIPTTDTPQLIDWSLMYDCPPAQ